MTDLVGIALAAGAGTRLRPLTELRPKALCPVGNVALVDRALEHLRGWTDDVAVNCHHLADQIVTHVGATAHLSVERPRALGTAGALGQLGAWIDGRDVLLVNADAYLTAPTGGGTLDRLMAGWDRQRCRLLVTPTDGGGDFVHDGAPVRYVGVCLLPWASVSKLRAEPTGLYEVLWRPELAAGRLDLVGHLGTAIDCGTPSDYLRANLHASGGASVIGEGATVDGDVERCVVWPGATVSAEEHLVECIRAGSAAEPMTVSAPLGDAPTPAGDGATR
ncbi:MAG TPA: NTP transferase domain-containing protein [Euzebyales bacterium]